MLFSCSTLSGYFIWTVLRRLVPFLSRPFREAEAKYKRQTSHIKAEPARWLTCITTTNYYRGLTFATGSLYIEKAFDRKMIPMVCGQLSYFVTIELYCSVWLKCSKVSQLVNPGLSISFQYARLTSAGQQMCPGRMLSTIF